jgi:predicted TIM-barrel fold metal-dependent hydrolase
MIITDCHVHIQPFQMFNAATFRVMTAARPNWNQLEEMAQSPGKFLKYLDEAGVDRAVLVNYVAPEVIGFTAEVNDWAANYCKADRKRLLAAGSVDVRHHPNVKAEMERLLRMGIRLMKIHPPHQLFYPNEYLNGLRGLEQVYRIAQEHGIPVMIHTGTSVFPGARNKYADPIYVDDVAVDFPGLKILLAHGGRPLWTDTAFFLTRRFPNVYLELSGIPPKTLLKSFPRLEQIADKAIFGTDWPDPGVPDIKGNFHDFQALPLSESAKATIISKNALTLWPE